MSTTHTVISFQVHSEQDFRRLFVATRAVLSEIGFDGRQTAQVILALSEIVTNAIRYAGYAEVHVSETLNKKGLKIIVQDNGPGIPDLDQAFQNGFSTFSMQSLGLGLGAARKSVDELDVETGRSGTRVTLRHYLKGHFAHLDVGVVSLPRVGEAFNGDACVIKEYHGEKLLVAVIDGAGHGANAHAASAAATRAIMANYQRPLPDIMQKVHDELCSQKKMLSVQVSVVRVTGQSIEFCSIGNVRTTLLSDPAIRLSINDGSPGIAMPDRIKVDVFDRPLRFTIAIHTDGIDSRFSLEEYRAIPFAKRKAEAIFNEHAMGEDDASIVVMASKP